VNVELINVKEDMTTSYDHDYLPWTDTAFVADPYPWYARLQADHPVYRLDENTYVVSRYADIMKYLRLPSMQTANAAWVGRDPWDAWKHTALLIEPPDHTRMRRATNRWFTPKMVKDWSETTRQHTDAAINNLRADGIIDAHLELGILPAHATMCRVLGLPADDLEPLSNAMTAAMVAIGFVHTEEQLEEAERGFAYITARVRRLLADKRDNPGDGLADALLAAQDRGEMTEEEVVETVSIFYAQGSPNSAYLIDSGLALFAERPDLLDTYRARPDIRAAFINELVRLNPVELSVTRFTTEDLDIEGTHVPAGSKVQFMIAAANRDPAVFEHADEFDFQRPIEASQNLSFGSGVHSCAGQVIARAETETVLTRIAEKFNTVEVVGEPKVGHTERFRTYDKLLMRLA
jgi:cytochrome P450